MAAFVTVLFGAWTAFFEGWLKGISLACFFYSPKWLSVRQIWLMEFRQSVIFDSSFWILCSEVSICGYRTRIPQNSVLFLNLFCLYVYFLPYLYTMLDFRLLMNKVLFLGLLETHCYFMKTEYIIWNFKFRRIYSTSVILMLQKEVGWYLWICSMLA